MAISPTIPTPITPDAPHLEALETLFKALSDRTRLRILALLAQAEVCVCEIHGALGIPQPTASRHLAYLRRCGLVSDRRKGLWVYYRLSDQADPVVRAVLGEVGRGLDHVRAQCCGSSESGCCR
jgi:ArsR family transcriptional regulator, arsenate/arsenite/antimonite-responsive transcriptional repressor